MRALGKAWQKHRVHNCSMGSTPFSTLSTLVCGVQFKSINSCKLDVIGNYGNPALEI